MTSATVDYASLENKRVILTVDRGEEGAEDIEGTVVSGNDMAVLFKPKGKSSLDIVEVGQIRAVEIVAAAPRALKGRKLKPVVDGKARKHALDAHGVTLTWANAVSEADARAWHDTVDHSDLGHFHAESDSDEDDSDE